MKRLICFDLDGTLTQHRSFLEENKKRFLDKLKEKYKIIMVGAGAAKRIYAQMGEYPIDIIANYGMEESKMIDVSLRLFVKLSPRLTEKTFLKNQSICERNMVIRNIRAKA